MPSMNSAFRVSVHGFLKSRSVSHSVEYRVKNGDTPPSNSSQFSTGVASAARLGAKLAAPPVVFQLVEEPISRITLGSSCSGCVICTCAKTQGAAAAIAKETTKSSFDRLMTTTLKPIVAIGSTHERNPNNRRFSQEYRGQSCHYPVLRTGRFTTGVRTLCGQLPRVCLRAFEPIAIRAAM